MTKFTLSIDKYEARKIVSNEYSYLIDESFNHALYTQFDLLHGGKFETNPTESINMTWAKKNGFVEKDKINITFTAEYTRIKIYLTEYTV